MRAKAEDRRVQRTHTLLREALLDLIAEKGYAAITVQDIVDRANVGRSTFYAHFLDKRELLLSGVNGLLTFLAQQGTTAAPSDEARTRLLEFSLPLFQHVQRNVRFCRALISTQSGTIVEPRILELLADLVRAELAAHLQRGTAPTIPLDVVVQYTVSALLGLLTWWMDQQLPCSAEEIDRRFRALTIPGISAALELDAVA